jgi:hypothetical protein
MLDKVIVRSVARIALVIHMDRSFTKDVRLDETTGHDIHGRRSRMKLLADLRSFIVCSHRECRYQIAGDCRRSTTNFCDDECDRVPISTKI